MRPTRSNLSPAVVATIALAALAVVFSGLVWVGRAPGMQTRKAEVANLLERTATLERRPGEANAWPAGAVCTGEPARAAATYRNSLAQIAAASGVTITAIDASPQPSTDTRELAGLGVKIKANGPYPRLLVMLSALSTQTPTLFVKTMDMRPRRDLVDLDLTGIVWCWAADHS